MASLSKLTTTVVIDAVQFTVDGDHGNFSEIESFTGGKAIWLGGEMRIDTLEGSMLASPSDWIIKGVKGEFYPCKPDIFAATYEPA